MELAYLYSFLSAVSLFLAAHPLLRRFYKEKYYSSFPKSLKNEEGFFNVDKKIVKIIEKKHKSLIKSANSKYRVERGPARVLSHEEVSKRIEKYSYVYFDDFTDEISDGLLDWNNENTELFFSSIQQDFGVSNRALLITLLYLRHEIKYFNFKDSIMRRAPESLEELLQKKIMYDKVNDEEPVSKYEIKRLACEAGFGLPLLPMQIALTRAKKSLKAKQFNKDFSKQESRVNGGADLRLVENSWKEAVRVDSDSSIDICLDSYVVVGRDHSRSNRLDSFYKKHLNFAVVDHFNSKCVDCDTRVNLQLDHFWCPKKEGGNFAMRSKAGRYVNNCIPLCQSCNAKKGAKPAYEYFEKEKMETLLLQSQKFDAFLNEHLQNFDDPDFNVLPRFGPLKSDDNVDKAS